MGKIIVIPSIVHLFMSGKVSTERIDGMINEEKVERNSIVFDD